MMSLDRSLDPNKNYMNNMPVGWAWVRGYEGLYAVNELADVFSFNLGRCLKPRVTGRCKYYKIDLYKDGKRTTKMLHKIVYEAFQGKVPEGYTINHIDHNRLNNWLSNLEALPFQEHNDLHRPLRVVALTLKYPYEKRYENYRDLKKAGYDPERIKRAIKHHTKYKGAWWYYQDPYDQKKKDLKPLD